ncbi:MAG TPA: ABC transporter permease, partial [Alphaproteobacteria bacterium]|nr:ABC transporter permease [Alphaproteobacteria bacterium]
MSQKSKAKIAFDATTLSLVRRLARDQIKPQVPRLLFALLCMAIAAGMTGTLAKLTEPILDDVFRSGRPERLSEIALIVLATFVIKGLATYGQAVTMNRVGMRIIANVQ